MTISGIDHLVITTSSLKSCINFYVGLLGMEHRVVDGHNTLFFPGGKISVHTSKGEFHPAALRPDYGSDDFCLTVEGDLQDVKAELEAKEAVTMSDIVYRHGARGLMQSLYLRDPDGNLVELCSYSEQSIVLRKMADMGIVCQPFMHEAILTVEQGLAIKVRMDIPAVKTLMLTNRQKKFFMVLLPGLKRLDTKLVANLTGSGHLAFATSEDLSRVLRAYPGAVSPLGLIFDEGHETTLIIDDEIIGYKAAGFHPCVNNCTVKLLMDDFIKRFLPSLGLRKSSAAEGMTVFEYT